MDASVPSKNREPHLRIVAVNDIYTITNYASLSTLIRDFRTKEPTPDTFLATLAGDFLSPSMLSSLDLGRGHADIVSRVGFTHVCLGNHEADLDDTELRERLTEVVRQSGLSIVSTNLRGFHDASMVDKSLIEVKSSKGRTVKIAILGLVTEDNGAYVGKPFAGLAIEPVNQTALDTSQQLLEKGEATSVILMTHQSGQRDRQLCQELGTQIPGLVPVILGGHDHVPFNELIANVRLVKAGQETIDAVVLDVYYSTEAPKQGEPDMPTRIDVEIVACQDYPPDEHLLARANKHMELVNELEHSILADLPPGLTLSSIGSRKQQTTLGAYLCSRIRDRLGAECCLINGGGLRGSRDYTHEFTYGNLKNELPFDNKQAVVPMLRPWKGRLRYRELKHPMANQAVSYNSTRT